MDNANHAGVEPPLGALWAKSDAGGMWHAVPSHLLDTVAVAELIWDRYMSRAFRGQLDGYCAGGGRDVFRLLCGWHDLGKATPAFQAKDPALCGQAQDSGWPMPARAATDRRVFHGASGAIVAERVLTSFGATGSHWLTPIIEGHHGKFGQIDRLITVLSGQGRAAAWQAGQERLAISIAETLDIDLTDLDLATPALGVQLQLSGWVSMADWIASSTHFPGTGSAMVDLPAARRRASAAWEDLGLRGGWHLASDHVVDFPKRFGVDPRPLQGVTLDAATAMQEPGLLIVEAPMGEGKTEAAFAATESMARRFGAGGVVFAMPTQGTTDAMWDRCRRWASEVDPDSIVALVHGKAALNPDWYALVSGNERISGVYDDDYGLPTTLQPQPGEPSAWLLGRHRALLAPSVVSTIDHLLLAVTRLKYATLRHAGLSGKVVVIDEVHSYDVYMAEYLQTLLRWLSDARIPVILMSATLPPHLREKLLAAYREGLGSTSAGGPELDVGGDSCYPLVTAWTAGDGVRRWSAPTWRDDLDVEVEVLGVADVDDVASIAALADERTSDGGCALVVLNTVARAQAVYRDLVQRGVPCRILHGRLTVSDRATRTAEAVDVLGSDSARRPQRLVIVATQIAEQSFDVDADLLITDVAPMDLLLQRIGRLHRHERPPEQRPANLRQPRVVVTGLLANTGGMPSFAAGFDYVYDRYALLASASALTAPHVAWSIPSMVPVLVEQAYARDRSWPDAWLEEVRLAQRERDESATDRAARAAEGTLTAPDTPFGPPTLSELHSRGHAENENRILVRDGEPSIEVALVRESAGERQTLSGRALGPHGERCSDPEIAREVLGDCVRLRSWDAERIGATRPLDAWEGGPLHRVPALVLDETWSTSGDWGSVTYHRDVGLVIERGIRG